MTSNSVWPSPLRLSIVGPGNVGSSLAFWAVDMGSELVQVGARRRPPAEWLVDKLGGSFSTIDELSSESEDLLLISVSDDAVPAVAERLAQRPQAAVALHTSGRLDASALDSLRQAGSSVGTIHPLRAFAGISTRVADAHSVVFAIEGDPPAAELATRLAAGWGGVAIEVAAQLRPLYHLLATLAAGGVMTLVSSACELAARIGLDDRVTRGYLTLAQRALERAESFDSPTQAITGPVARGDLPDYLAQIDQLRRIDPELAAIAEQLAYRTELLLNKRDA